MKIYWNEFYKENEMIEVGQVWPSRYQRDFSTKITLIFHLNYHRLLPPTKRTVNITLTFNFLSSIKYYSL